MIPFLFTSLLDLPPVRGRRCDLGPYQNHLTPDPLLQGEGTQRSGPGTLLTERTGDMGDTWQSIGREDVADAMEGDPCDGRAVKVHRGVPGK
jgi:hypothetical protein